MKSIVITALTFMKGKNPAIVLGEKSIRLLGAFVAGIEYKETRAWTYMPDYYFRASFHKWVAERFGMSNTTLGWESIILMQADHDDEKAYDLFFTLFDAYLREEHLSD